MSAGLLRRHFTSACLALCLALAAPGSRAFTPPDPVSFGVRVEAGDLATVGGWLDAGLDPNYLADRIGTGLMIASWYGDLKMMRLFLAHGADPNFSNALGEQALMHAAWRGQLAAVDLLLASGARVDNPPLHWGALHYAAFAGHGDVVARLLERGADVNARSPNGSSVLMMAVYDGHEDVVKQLLARGADTAIRNERGDGALQWAMKFQRLGIARLVSGKAQFAAAASKPRADWGEARRSQPAPAPLASAEVDARVAELERIRKVLLERRMTDAVRRLDRHIAVLREAMLPPPSASGAPQLADLRELVDIRELLAARGMNKSVRKLDRRIAALRARLARPDLDKTTPARLEISARREAPQDQSVRLVTEPKAPQP